MAFDWITFLITLGIGIVGGILSGTATTLAGRIALKRKIKKELKRIQNFGEKSVLIGRKKFESLLVWRIDKQAVFCFFNYKQASFCSSIGSCIGFVDGRIYIFIHLALFRNYIIMMVNELVDNFPACF